MTDRVRRYRGNRKPRSRGSLWAAACGAGSIVMFAFALFASARTQGASANVIGGLCVLAMLVAIVALVYGVRFFKNENFDKLSRVLGVVVPFLATFGWIMLYCIGIFIG